MVTAAVVAAGAVAAGATAYAGNQAASAQRHSADQANATQKAMFNTTQENLAPFIGSGTQANQMLQDQLPSLTAPVVMNQKALEQTPGYQFELRQGLKSVQNSAASRGLGASGAALKGASQFATGLASSNYQQQFNNAVTNQTNSYNRLLSAAGLGENAAAGLGNNAVTTGGNMGANTIGAGNATAASYNATGNAFSGAANNVGAYSFLQGLQQNQGLYGGGINSMPTSNALTTDPSVIGAGGGVY